MTEPKTFITRDLLDRFRAEGHAPRTRQAFMSGVRAAALGRRPVGYQYSSYDYREAAEAGYLAALERLQDGEQWECGECGAHHDGAEALDA